MWCVLYAGQYWVKKIFREKKLLNIKNVGYFFSNSSSSLRAMNGHCFPLSHEEDKHKNKIKSK